MNAFFDCRINFMIRNVFILLFCTGIGCGPFFHSNSTNRRQYPANVTVAYSNNYCTVIVTCIAAGIGCVQDNPGPGQALPQACTQLATYNGELGAQFTINCRSHRWVMTAIDGIQQLASSPIHNLQCYASHTVCG